MKPKYLKALLFIGCLIVITGAAMAYSNRGNPWMPNLSKDPNPDNINKNGLISLTGHLVQDKVLQGGVGTVDVALSLHVDDMLNPNKGNAHNADMVIVLDRSGSMKGSKIRNAKRAILNLLSDLSEKDRFALIAYSDRVEKYSDLVSVTGVNRRRLISLVNRMWADGRTNLGAGLQTGINTLLKAKKMGNTGKIILISDGLANQGITDSFSLGNMASIAVEKEFSVATVGVGTEFNEQLMTYIADQGAGNYYYLKNPRVFAEVFQKEFYNSRATVATAVEIQIPLRNGMSLVNASGYPIKVTKDHALFHPGNLHSGQTRKLFLTFKMPTRKQRTFEINGITVRYIHKGQAYNALLPESLQIACVKNQREVISSIDKEEWEKQVVQDDYNKLKDEVSMDIKDGKEKKALDRIQTYYRKKQQINTFVGSGKVAKNLDKDLNELRHFVKDTFKGNPETVMQKQKANSKALQYEGYKGRRTN
jgi:Ca-activated chloride channel family protein